MGGSMKVEDVYGVPRGLFVSQGGALLTISAAELLTDQGNQFITRDFISVEPDEVIYFFINIGKSSSSDLTLRANWEFSSDTEHDIEMYSNPIVGNRGEEINLHNNHGFHAEHDFYSKLYIGATVIDPGDLFLRSKILAEKKSYGGISEVGNFILTEDTSYLAKITNQGTGGWLEYFFSFFQIYTGDASFATTTSTTTSTTSTSTSTTSTTV